MVFSGGILKSAVHRAVPPPGAQEEHVHWFLLFSTRPNSTQVLRMLAEDSPAIAESVRRYPEGKFETASTGFSGE